MKFALIAALAAAASAIKLADYPTQTGNYSPREDEYSDFHPHVQTYTWDSTGNYPSINRLRTGYQERSAQNVDDNGQGHGNGKTFW